MGEGWSRGAGVVWVIAATWCTFASLPPPSSNRSSCSLPIPPCNFPVSDFGGGAASNGRAHRDPCRCTQSAAMQGAASDDEIDAQRPQECVVLVGCHRAEGVGGADGEVLRGTRRRSLVRPHARHTPTQEWHALSDATLPCCAFVAVLQRYTTSHHTPHHATHLVHIVAQTSVVQGAARRARPP